MHSPLVTSSAKIVYKEDGRRQLARFDKVQNRVVRENITDEDVYLKTIGDIIQRDYFPHLASMKGENKTAWDETELNNFDLSRNPEGPKLPSLNKYLANNTTEDNASFTELVEEHEKQQAAKLAVFFNTASTKSALPAASQMLAIEQGKSDKDSPKPIVSSRRLIAGNNSVHFLPECAHLTADELGNHLARDENIRVQNTRFKRPIGLPLNKKRLAAGKALLKMGHFGPDGKMSTEDIASMGLGCTPQHAGDNLAFMDASPSPCPAAASATPLMTWGELDATPSRLDGSATPLDLAHGGGGVGVPSFHITEPSSREQLAHRLADRASRQRIQGRQQELAKRVHQSRLMSPAASAKLLSPAARRLLSNSTVGVFGRHLALTGSSGTSGLLSRPGTADSADAVRSPAGLRLQMLTRQLGYRATSRLGTDSSRPDTDMSAAGGVEKGRCVLKSGGSGATVAERNAAGGESTAMTVKTRTTRSVGHRVREMDAASLTDNLLNLKKND